MNIRSRSPEYIMAKIIKKEETEIFDKIMLNDEIYLDNMSNIKANDYSLQKVGRIRKDEMRSSELVMLIGTKYPFVVKILPEMEEVEPFKTANMISVQPNQK